MSNPFLRCAFAFLALFAATGRAAADDLLEAALERAGERRAAWEAALAGLEGEARADVAFLVAHMPASDLAALGPDFVAADARLAREHWRAAPWSATIDETLFREALLPYANLDEAREDWRTTLRERALPLVKGVTDCGAAALALNAQLFGALNVRYSTKRRRANQAPSESIETGLASCSGLSILLVDACRSVGVPARVVGIGAWPHKNGNHTWVEVWDGAAWRFVGAAEPDAAGFDRAWFVGDAREAVAGHEQHAVVAAQWSATGRIFHLPWDADSRAVNGVDVTARYTGAAAAASGVPEGHVRLWVRVWKGGKRVANPVAIEPDGWSAPATELARAGVSRDESKDTNDMLEFVVPVGTAWIVKVADGEAVLNHRVAASSLANDLQLELPAPQDDPITRAFAAAFAALASGEPLPAFDPLIDAALAKDPATVRAAAWSAFLAAPHADLVADHAERLVRTTDRTSPYTLEVVGEKPANGWPLVIAMHGGGGAPPEVNDQQWQHMQIYYNDHPEAGGYLYVALRAPNNEWNGVYDDAIVPLVDRLIRQLVVCEGVDTERVHAIGYSHGGYGAFVIGPKAPDRFAAVHSSAAAPTDGETRLENLVNLRFTFMCGERDTAYGRRERCDATAKLLTEIQTAARARWKSATLYPFEYLFVAGVGHGGLPDRDLLPKLLEHRRRAAASHLVWHTSDDRIADHDWVFLPEPKDGAVIEGHVTGLNTFEVSANGVPRIELWLDERLVDPARPVTVRFNGGEPSEHTLRPSAAVLAASLWRRADLGRSATMVLPLAPN
jgi:dienelactone hydrolase